jgi:putative ABC transport system permease protein
MLIIIKERTKEIGIQRAIGATPWRIMSQIVTESVTLTAMAGSFGLVLGVFLLEVINNMLASSAEKSEMFKNPEVDLQVAVTALIVLIISGVVAGLIPARKAVSMKPVDALRYE